MEKDKYVVITYNNGSVWQLPYKVVADNLAHNMATTGDILLSEAIKQVKQSSDAVVARWVHCMSWDECVDDARLVKGGVEVIPISNERDSKHVEVMTAAEIDRFKTADV